MIVSFLIMWLFIFCICMVVVLSFIWVVILILSVSVLNSCVSSRLCMKRSRLSVFICRVLLIVLRCRLVRLCRCRVV